MAVNIIVPPLGESVLEATVSRWLKQPGEHVAAGEAVVELETEKVNLEVGAEKAGVLARIERPAGVDVRIGDVLGVIEPDGAAQPAAEPAAPSAAQAAPGAGDGRRDELPAPSPAAPPQRSAATTAEAAATPSATSVTESAAAATPVARRMAEQEGVDLAQVRPAALGRRVTKQDVQSYLEQRPPTAEVPAPVTPPAAPAAAPAAPAPAGPEVAAPPGARREERTRMSRRRRTIARRLVEAQQTAAMLTTFNELDMGAVMDMRKRRKDAFKEQHGVGLGFMSFFVKASLGGLKAFPVLNAEVQADEIVFKHYYDIGIAVGAADGLVVPVLREADRLSFAEMERQIEQYVAQAHDGTLSLESLRGGTFTISNGGVFGSLLSTPILNLPQVGILGLHKIEERPVARAGQVIIRPMMYVALSYDHRIVDGREAVQFLVRIKELIEDPERLLLEG